jgi:hypothetical protein
MAKHDLSKEDRDDPPGGTLQAGANEWGGYAGYGLQFATIIGLFALAGWKLDAWLGTEPWLLLLLLLLGFIGGTVSLVKQLPVSDQAAKKRP